MVVSFVLRLIGVLFYKYVIWGFVLFMEGGFYGFYGYYVIFFLGKV